MNPILLFGAGPLGKMALDIMKSNHQVVFGFLDDNKLLHGTEIGEIAVLGATEDDGFLKLIGQKCDAVIAVESAKERVFLFDLLKERRHLVPVNAVHALASLSEYAAIGHGNLLAAGSRISAFSELGDGCVLYPNSVVETDGKLGSQVIVGAGAVIGVGVQVEDGVFIGPGVTLLPGIKIGRNASIGAGSVVLADVASGNKMFGFPAQKV